MDTLRVCPGDKTLNTVLNSSDEEVYLYEVRTSWTKAGKRNEARGFVLACSVALAEGQHQCVLGISSYLEGHEASNVASSAIRVPFAIQGWSARVF